MHIVLDLDGTLIKYGENKARPHLRMFLEYCFDRFYTVSIWTAAKQEWYDQVFEKTLKPIIESISIQLDRPCLFYLIMTRQHCEWNGQMSTKPLLMLWENFPHMNAKNTFIVDDSPHNYGFNYDNGIHIPKYTGGDDNYLEKLVEFFQSFNNTDSILEIDKFLWFKKSHQSLEQTHDNEEQYVYYDCGAHS